MKAIFLNLGSLDSTKNFDVSISVITIWLSYLKDAQGLKLFTTLEHWELFLSDYLHSENIFFGPAKYTFRKLMQ